MLRKREHIGHCLQLGKLVADNVLSLDQKFWLRLATRSDTASSKEEKTK